MVVALCSALISSVLRRLPRIQKKLPLKKRESIWSWLVKSDEMSETIWNISLGGDCGGAGQREGCVLPTTQVQAIPVSTSHGCD